MKNRWITRAVVLLILAALLNVTFAVAAEVGSSDDPIVTLSYLRDVYTPDLLKKVDTTLETRNTELKKDFSLQVQEAKEDLASEASGSDAVVIGSSDAAFGLVTLTSGQVLTGDIGCEAMLRVGTASCVSPSSPGLIDETSGGTLQSGGALQKNHLYMMTIEGRGLKATAGTVKLLVRGTYTVS